MENYKNIVEDVSGVKDISIRNRKDYIVHLRYVYFDLCKKYADPKVSLFKIGKEVNRDHASVLHGLNQVDTKLFTRLFFANDEYKEAQKKIILYLSYSFDIEKKIEDLIYKNTNDDPEKSIELSLVNDYWRERNEKLKEQLESSLDDLSNVNERLKGLDLETIEAIKELSEDDFNEFQERNRLFLKVKKSLNSNREFK